MKLYCKISDLFCWFLLALRFSATNSGMKKTDNVHWTCGNNIFKKKGYKYQILNHLYFGPSFVFRGTALGRFSQCFFLIFCRRSTMVSDVFIQPPHHHHHHKKASYSPVMSITISIITADISIFENLTIFLMSF